MSDDQAIKKAVQAHYSGLVSGGGTSCCCGPAIMDLSGFGEENYDAESLKGVPREAAAFSFGCGNPLAMTELGRGQIVLDIGSGAGLDAIIAASKVGLEGHVFGLDMTPEMIKLGEENATSAGCHNITFLQGEAEDMPLANDTIDWVISNCVINLSPDKEKVFQEIFRVLKPGGKLLISDMVAENLPEALKENSKAWSACIAGAVSEVEYIKTMVAVGLQHVKVVGRQDYDIAGFRGLLEESFPGRADELIALARAAKVSVASLRVSGMKPAI